MNGPAFLGFHDWPHLVKRSTIDMSPHRYFVGTYEARPGAGAEDYTNPSPDYTAGNHQGDGPTGTLTSETFTVGGDYGSEVNVGL